MTNSDTIFKIHHAKEFGYVKCPRCWHWHPGISNFGHTEEDIVQDPKLKDEHLCAKCCDVITADFPDHPSVPFIKNCGIR